MKKWYQKLSHPWAKSTAGFTLVELIVVIAILGVLGGVGAVGYSGYMKSSQQKADEAIVSNVIRAVDTGIKSGLYNLESVMQVEVDNAATLQQSGIQLPVGFVLLDTEGTKVLTATNAEKTTIGRDCEFADVSTFLANNKIFDANAAGNTAAANRIAVQSKEYVKTCGTLSKHDIYKVVNGSAYTYIAPVYSTNLGTKLTGDKICLTHSVLRYTDINVGQGTESVLTACGGGISHRKTYTDMVSGDHTERVIDFNASKFVCCDENSQTKFETYGDNYAAGPDDAKTSMLSQSLNAAFGDYTTVKLQSTDWVEASTIPTFFSDVSGMFEDVENLSNLLMGIVTMDKENYMAVANLKGTGTGLHIYADLVVKKIDKTATITKDTHDSSSDLVYDIATKVVTTHTSEDNFINNAWNAIDTNSYPYNQEGFGLNGREYFLAARTGYNLGFSEYVGSRCPEHATQIKEFGQPAVDLVLDEIGMAGDATMTSVMNGIIGDLVPDADVSSAKMPYCVQESVFGDASLATNFPFTACETCKGLYKQYKDSGTCEENGRAFYQMMVTAASTPENLVNGTNDDAAFFDYYKGYVNAFGELYSQAQTAANNGAVVISVYMDGNEFDYAVSPNSLDARNKVEG